jgi:hypothetical protein
MKNFGKLLVAAIGALSLGAAGSFTVLAHEDHRILHFDSMTAVAPPLLGPVTTRNLPGGGKAWVIASGSGEVHSNGHVQVSVTGLVIPEFGNTNPVKLFKAVVSCITQHDLIVNVSTNTFPADTAGNSTIDDTVTLPHPCAHPILFVTSAGGSWFAMSTPRDDEENGD